MDVSASENGLESLEVDWFSQLARRRVSDCADRIAEMERRAEDRDDLAGVKLLLRTLSLMATQSKRLIETHLALGAEAADSERDIHLYTVRKAVLQLEQVCGRTCEALISPPERDVAALVQPYVRLARRITGNDDTELIFESGESFGYAVWADVFEDVREGVEILAPGLKETVEDLPPLALVTYPGRGDHETLLHAVIAHEVTHITLSMAKAAPSSPISEAFEAEIGDLELSEREIKRLDLWLNEFLADALALRIVGPAFFFGLLEYLLPTHDPDQGYGDEDEEIEEEEDESSHPPPSWRFERLLDPVKKFFTETDGYLGKAAETYEKCLQLVPEPATREEDSVAARDYDLLTKILEKIDLDKIVGDAAYPEARFWRDLPLVWQKLEQDIAPVERVKGRRAGDGQAEEEAPLHPEEEGRFVHETEWSQTIDWRSILNGGYLHFLHGAMLESEPKDEAERRRRDRHYVNSLIRGAIELSELHRRMIELSGQFDALNPYEREG
jgi:hypothetical protein